MAAFRQDRKVGAGSGMATISGVSAAHGTTQPAYSRTGAEPEAAAGAAPEPRESVSLSPLAQSLSGKAGALFSKLNDPLREKLVGLVQSRALSAEDVAAGLSGFAKAAKSAESSDHLVPNDFRGTQQGLADRTLENIGKSLSIAAQLKQPGIYHSEELQRQADALADERRTLRQAGEAAMEKMVQEDNRILQSVIRSGGGIRLEEGIAMARLRETGVGDEIAKAAAE